MTIFLFNTITNNAPFPSFNYVTVLYMLNLRQFSRPNPCDSHCHQRGEALGMPNHTNTPFYYVRSAGGYMGETRNPMTYGGITILKEPKYAPKSNNILFNALVNPPHYPHVSHLVDSRLTLPKPLIQPPSLPI